MSTIDERGQMPLYPRQAVVKGSSEARIESRYGSQVAHTLTACCRCRQRKTRCDPGLPRCTPCERNDAICDYFDAAKGRKMPRAYVVQLQEKVRQLEAELDGLSSDPDLPLDFEILVRGAGLVKIRENDEPRFLGPSSGIAMTRLVMELAKELCNVKSIREVVPESMAQGIKELFAQEQSKPTSKVYPLISFVAAPNLPSQELTDKLVENFMLKVQIHYPILHEPSFQRVIKEVYHGSTDDCKNFMLRMVIALSMHKLDTQYAGLADSYYLAALPYLENAIRPLNEGTLQCFALIALYSMTTPTRTAAYWVVGLAVKLLQDLGMTDEATIGLDKSGKPLDAVEVDVRRRLFWAMTTLELGLAHTLGRPSAFAFTHDHADVRPFLAVDDQYLTPNGVIPGSPTSFKKQVAIHLMKMRYLQLEIRRTLYLRKRPEPTSDSDPWFSQMESKIHKWMETYPRANDGNDLSQKWFKIEYHTMIVFLFRPSPQVPHPSVRAARLCFDASRFNIYFQKEQTDTKAADTTWIFTQQLFMAINTMLWAMSYAEIREDYPKLDIEKDLKVALDAIWWASRKWPGVESALELYTLLVQACLKAYDGDTRASYGVVSPVHHTSTASPSSLGDNPPSSASSEPYGLAIPLQISHKASLRQATPPYPPLNGLTHMDDSSPRASSDIGFTKTTEHVPTLDSLQVQEPYYNLTMPGIDPTSLYNPLPPPVGYNSSHSTPENLLPLLTHDRNLFMGSFDDQFTDLQYMSQPMDGLNLEQQSELMNNLELHGLNGPPKQDGVDLDDISGYKSQSYAPDTHELNGN